MFPDQAVAIEEILSISKGDETIVREKPGIFPYSKHEYTDPDEYNEPRERTVARHMHTMIVGFHGNIKRAGGCVANGSE